MRRRHSSVYSEVLECRAVPTALIGAPVAGAAAARQQSAALNEAKRVFGIIHGTYSTPSLTSSGNPFGGGVDAGTTNAFIGQGKLPTFGSVKVTGSLTGTGNIAVGQANGEITLTSSVGSVTLQLTGPNQGMFSPLPKNFKFTVVSGTGDFTHLQMTGTINLAELPKNHTFLMTFVSVKVSDTSTLAGTGHGNYSMGFVTDAGPLYKLSGTASLEFMGDVKVSGSVQATGFTTSGQATGTITLTNKQGSVKLSLVGPKQSGFSPLPTQFQFKVIHATGAYTTLKMTGTIDLTLNVFLPPIIPVNSRNPSSGPGSPPVMGGNFSFKIKPKTI